MPGVRSNTTIGRTAEHFRPDIEGLRGLAVMLVVVFHAFPALVGGGFIGVDVFFVISGYLITGLLVRELERTGKLDLRAFYVRRIRRLVPAAALALGVTLLLAAWLLPPLDLREAAVDGLAATFSVSNIRFALSEGDYFAAVADPSPFLHYWSLSVEEQFYLLWPALLIVLHRLAPGRRSLFVGVTLVAIASLWAALLVTDVASQWAFYSLPTRAWQLALGGLLALGLLQRATASRPSGPRAAIGWLGLAAVMLAALGLDDRLAYPGAWALLPTFGAVAIIAVGRERLGPGLILTIWPARFLGRISYALYLWHWPLLVLPAIALGGELTPAGRIGLVVVAILVASASTLLVEEPLRRVPVGLPRQRQLDQAVGLVAVLLTSVAVGLGSVAWVRAAAEAEAGAPQEQVAVGQGRRDRDRTDRAAGRSRDGPGDARIEVGRQLDRSESPGPAASVSPERSASPEGSSAIARGGTPRPARSPRADRTPRPNRTPRPTPAPTPPVIIRLPADVRPALFKARDDKEALVRNGCLHIEDAAVPRDCRFGASRGRVVVALVRDSHASHWFPALDRVANRQGWRLYTFVKVSCPFAGMPVLSFALDRTYHECARFNDNVVTQLKRLRPTLVVTALSRWQHPTRSADEPIRAQGAAMARMLDQVPGHKVVIADVPYPKLDVPACLSKNLKDIRPCAVPSYQRTSGGSPARERTAARLTGGAFLDFGDIICTQRGSCPVVNRNRIIYRDTHHLTATFSRWLAPAMERALVRVLRRQR
ncbi:hypothetical protein BH23CHL8_BH23CHL8_04370 [soil metagenome]